MKTPMIMLVAGLLSLAAGVWMQLSAGAPAAEPALTQQCQTVMKARGADTAMIAQCGEKAFATTVTATDAQDAARSISAANNSEVGSYALSMLLIGLGAALSIFGGVLMRRSRAA